MEPPSPATMPSAATSWRHTTGACLSSSGWACPGAGQIYADRIDWHQVARLVQRGCPPRLAPRIVS